MTTPTNDRTSDVLTDFAVARAAHLAGDRNLEREARRILELDHGIRVSFLRKRPVAEGQP